MVRILAIIRVCFETLKSLPRLIFPEQEGRGCPLGDDCEITPSRGQETPH
jgi:hypothetical protein